MEFGRSPALLLLVGFLWSQLQFGAEAAGTTVFTLRNNCTYTVWPTTLSGNTAVGGRRGRRLRAITRRQRLIPSPGWLVRPLMGVHRLCTLRHHVPHLRHGVLRRRRELLPRRRAARHPRRVHLLPRRRTARHPRRVHAGRRRREGLLRREPRGRRPTGESAHCSSPRRTRSAPRRPSPPPTRSFSPHRCRVAPRRPPTPSSSRRLSQRREREMRREKSGKERERGG
uniref:Thaumatin-like protein n=1 Tax=Oryza nivara TaxID=4536 RepID=A0A0E0H405_ORYNI